MITPCIAVIDARVSAPSAYSSLSSPTVKRAESVETLRTASSTPGMKELRSIESWRRERVCPSPPNITSWWATSPGRRIEWIGSWTLPPEASDQLRGALGRARGGIELAVVVELDDLALGHVGRDPLRCLHQEHGADRKVGGGETVGPGPRRLGGQACRIEVKAGCPDHDMDAGGETGPQIGESNFGGREVDDDVGLAQQVAELDSQRGIGTSP